MSRASLPTLALAVLLALAGVGTVVDDVAPRAEAADDAWRLPTVPPKCSSSQMNSGNVSGCVVMGGYGVPESLGWPTPPFPVATPGAPAVWMDISIGASGSLVKIIQQTLTAAGYTLSADGQFGPITQSKVKAFQTDQGLASTGIVDQATADALGVEATSGGAFPPAGWVWKGWTYSGSPILADWEALLASNLAPIGPVTAGRVTLMPEALALFTGFLSEIIGRGYSVRDIGGYSFRCTASTKKSCEGLTREALSNHAYGLAVDFNTGSNPLQTYYGIGGASACQTPMTTDLPQWAIEIAEKWGLYWGGYGWSSGCSSPAQVKSSASRDPMHFEFRGSPTQARVILQYNLENNPYYVPPSDNCLKLINAVGAIERCLGPGEAPRSGSRVLVQTAAPAGASAALVNLTLTGSGATGFATAESCGSAPTARQWSNANTGAGRTVANLAVVPLDAEGRFCLYVSTAMHVIVDVAGYFASVDSAPGGSLFTPIEPSRLLDTRVDGVCRPEGPCRTTGPASLGEETAIDVNDVPPSASAVLLNLTVTQPTNRGYLTANSCSALEPGPQKSSNVNFAVGSTVANLAVVPTDATADGVRVCTYSIATAHEVVDVQGYFGPAADGGLGYTALTPERLIDTRGCWTDALSDQQRCAQINPAGSLVSLRAPAGASAVLVNLTLTGAARSGWAAAGACSGMIGSPPSTSNTNVAQGVTAANLAVVPVDGDGMFCIYVSTATHVVVDLQGTFSPSGPLRFTAVDPTRRLDTRFAPP